MLIVTPAAAAAVTALLQSPQTPEATGLRLQQGLDATGEATIGVAVVRTPEPDDDVLAATGGGHLFLAPDVADMLDNQVLDAEIHDENVAFTIRPQRLDGQPPVT
jgi:Fe-S cluster assembly iron-binding protein IscA